MNEMHPHHTARAYASDSSHYRRPAFAEEHPSAATHPRPSDTASFPPPRDFHTTTAEQRRKTQRAWSRLVVAFIVAAILLLALLIHYTHDAESLALPEGLPTLGSLPFAPQSTDAADWRKGEIPFLYQTDSAWADAPYAGDTVRTAGCGPTCLAMAYIALTGNTDLDPAAMAAFSEQNGFMEEGLTSWALMTQGAAMLGLESEELPADAQAVASALDLGKVVVASMGPGDFTTQGHFIVIAGMNDAGEFLVRDPNSVERSNKTWDAERVLDQCRNIWTLSTTITW